jgi:predicted nucleic acid-binding protein
MENMLSKKATYFSGIECEERPLLQTARKLAQRADLVKRLGLYREKISALVKLGLGFETCTSTDFFEAAFAYQEKYGLLMNDSLILATALRLKADGY